MRTPVQVLPCNSNVWSERQALTVISIILGTLSLLTPLLGQLSVSANEHSSPESTLLAGRGEESDKCVWLGICD